MATAWDPPRPGWTCAECGFDFDATDPASTAEEVREAGARYRRPLSRGLPGEDLDAVLRARPGEGTWSALEYACHVRDVLGLNEDRFTRVLAEDRLEVTPMDPDRRAVERAYNEQRPDVVAVELEAAADRLAGILAGLAPASWSRAIVRQGHEFTLDWMARNVVHECRHHLLDVGRTLRHARGRAES